MQVENHKEEVPFSHYAQQFSMLDPQETANRTGTVWDGQDFTLRLLGQDYRITWPAYTISTPDGSPIPPLPTQTFLLRYLLESHPADWHGSWKTFREMPWGEMYITPYTGRVLTRAAFTFGSRLDAFRRACEKLGGIPLPHGDAGFQFTLIGHFQMQLIVWAGDDEFSPNAQVLYSDNFSDGFAAEDRVVAGDILISVIKSLM